MPDLAATAGGVVAVPFAAVARWRSAPRLQVGRPFATLRVTGAHRPLDTGLRFDAVRNPPPGLLADGPPTRLREPAYAAAGRVGA